MIQVAICDDDKALTKNIEQLLRVTAARQNIDIVIVNKKVPLLSEEIPHLFLNLYRWGSPPIKNPIILNLCKLVFLYVYFQH